MQVEQVEAPELIAAEVLNRCPAKQLMALYKVPAFKDCDDFLQNVAFQRGKLLPGGIGDAKSAARVVLHDWHNGKIPYYTLPPVRETIGQQEAVIMPSFGEAFNADKVKSWNLLFCLVWLVIAQPPICQRNGCAETIPGKKDKYSSKR